MGNVGFEHYGASRSFIPTPPITLHKPRHPTGVRRLKDLKRAYTLVRSTSPESTILGVGESFVDIVLT